ncbi:RNA polymerase sigma factor [Rubellicoccus peritrichatus]|uniref:RNA polymerase sigma factor n=1 Tax=Rubellicoccus peritrichatus TaxID=3080537 RepID=A0AAQ3QX03_9BACT|nr:RNA polymerase sigma factor [Puniceicoccus sp. CR14]WOO42482.1 RNA polymerase sigma factor [Puniceicoccus sp. CR14]
MESNEPDIRQLTRRMRKGNEMAYREFYDKYSLRLLRYLVALHTGNLEAARETMQDTFLKVAKHIRCFDDEAVFWGWLRAVAKSVFLDHTRKQGRYWRMLNRFRAEPISNEPVEDHLNEALQKALEAMPATERDLIEAKYFRKSSYEEIAQQLGLTGKAVENRLARARSSLRDKMERLLKDA